MWALVRGLPPEAAVWREDMPAWTLEHELLAVAAERQDQWERLKVQIAIDPPKRGDTVPVPGELQIRHPDRPAPPEPETVRPITERHEIEAFFRRHAAGR